jgi:hypothetical protein
MESWFGVGIKDVIRRVAEPEKQWADQCQGKFSMRKSTDCGDD